jgi:hypothetical protein
LAKAVVGPYNGDVSQLASPQRQGAQRVRHWLEGAQERLEASRLGRALISVFLLVTIGAIAVVNLPDSEVKGRLLTVGGPYLSATGLDQNWGVFAPDSRRSVLLLVARVRYADGSTATWRLPEGGPLLGAYWDYRWRKWAENVMTLGGDAASVQRPAAVWIARTMQRPRKRPTLVTLVTRSSDLPPPGTRGAAKGRWRESVVYRLAFR